MLSLQSPENLVGAAGVVILLSLARYFGRFSSGPGVYFPGIAWLRPLSGPGRSLPWIARGALAAAILLLAVGLGRPQYRSEREEIAAKGVDIVLVLDISTSMSAKDFTPSNRLEAARAVMRDFVRRRPFDRLAVITFAADAYVLCPLTADHYSLLALLDSVELIPFEADGTAIGMALAAAVNRLRDSPARSRVVVLLTDGINNRGEISPLQAADFCRRYGIRVYAVGIGSRGETDVLARATDGRPVYIRTKVNFDPAVLDEIARLTGGKSYLAGDGRGLREIYATIDSMEKSVLERKQVTYQRDLLPIFLWGAFVLMLAALAIAVKCPACF